MKITREQLAKKLGVTRQRVHNMVKQGLIVPDAEGKFDLDEVLTSINVNRDPSRGGKQATAAAEGSFYEHRTRKEAALASLRELEAQEKAGQLVNVGTLNSYLAKMFTSVKTRLRSIPAMVSGELTDIARAKEGRAATVEIMRLLLKEIDEALNELATYPQKEVKNAEKTDVI